MHSFRSRGLRESLAKPYLARDCRALENHVDREAALSDIAARPATATWADPGGNANREFAIRAWYDKNGNGEKDGEEKSRLLHVQIVGIEITGLSPEDSVELGDDLTVYYRVIGPPGFSFARAELRVSNDEVGAVIYVRADLSGNTGEHTTKWKEAKWNQSPHSGAYANPSKGDWKINVVGIKGNKEIVSNEMTIQTDFVIRAEITDPPSPLAAGLVDLQGNLTVVVYSDFDAYVFYWWNIIFGDILNGVRVKVDHWDLNTLEDGRWTIQLKDVRDDIGNFYDANPATPDIEHDEWTIELR